MKIGPQLLNFGPGMVAIYLPTIPHRFWALKPINEFCWFTLDGPLAEEFILQLGLNVGVFHCQPPALEKIYELMDCLKDHTIQGRRHASLLAIDMLYEITNSIRTPRVAPLVQCPPSHRAGIRRSRTFRRANRRRPKLSSRFPQPAFSQTNRRHDDGISDPCPPPGSQKPLAVHSGQGCRRRGKMRIPRGNVFQPVDSQTHRKNRPRNAAFRMNRSFRQNFPRFGKSLAVTIEWKPSPPHAP